MKPEKNILRFNIVLGLLTVIGGLCYDTVSHNLITKAIASFGFALLGLVNMLYGSRRGFSHRSFALIMVIGLFTGMAADIVLEIDFMMGALIFALGHVFYIAAYSKLLPFKAGDMVPGLLIFVPVAALVLFLPIFDFGGTAMQIVCLVYAGIIGIMCGKAFSNLRKQPRPLTKLLALGSLLFLLSDLCLLFSNFAQVPGIVGSVCVNSYYPAQVILACALLCTGEG